MDIITVLRWHLQLITWRDYSEIFFFSLMFYALTRWLAADTDKKLLAYFYGYCTISLMAYLAHLPTVTYCLFLFSPVVIMLFMMLHQETLQRNMISLKNIMVPAEQQRDWLEYFLRGILKTLHTNNPMFIILEHNDALSPYLDIMFPLDAHITEGFFNLVIEKQVYDPSRMILITSDGLIRGINATWKARWHTTDYTEPDAWIDDAITYTKKADALVVYANPENHTCTIAVEGELHKNLSIDQTAQLIKRHIKYPLQFSIKKGLEYGVTQKKERVEQRTP